MELCTQQRLRSLVAAIYRHSCLKSIMEQLQLQAYSTVALPGGRDMSNLGAAELKCNSHLEQTRVCPHDMSRSW